VATRLTSAKPSHAGDVFPWVPRLSKQQLTELHDLGGHGAASLYFLGLTAGLFALYGALLALLRGRQSAGTEAVLFGTGAALLLLHATAPVMLSADVYAYAVYGRVLAVYGGNPYGQEPPTNPADPFLPLFGQEYLPAPYGPVCVLVSGGWQPRAATGSA
jgi:hypothetical protein